MKNREYNILSFRYHDYEEREGFHRYPCYDLFIDDKNLTEYFSNYAQFVTPFGVGYKDIRDELGPIDEYLGNREPGDAYGLRFLICGECHDPGCGGIWGKIKFSESEVLWYDFSDGEESLRFCFDRHQYELTFSELEKEIRQKHSLNE